MIHKFSFKNFYSFNEQSEVSFVVGTKKAGIGDSYFTSASKTRLTKLLAVIGPNASGKTSLLRVLPFLQWLIVDSSETKPDSEIPFQKFLLTGNKKSSPSFFSVDFEIDSRVYRYAVELVKERILSESLRVKEDNSKRFRILIARKWDRKKQEYSFSSDALKKFGLTVDFPKLVRQNTSMLSTAAQLKHPLSLDIFRYWERMYTNVVEHGRSSQEGSQIRLIDTAGFLKENQSIKRKTEEILVKYDLGLSGIEIKKFQVGTEKNSVFFPFGVHKIDEKKNVSFPFNRESSGTKNLFLAVSRMLAALESGGLVVLDEFDSELHPHMLPELIRLFSSKFYNPKNVQLFFSTHNTRILEDLDKYQIVFVEKNERGESESWRLDEAGVRPDDNYYSKYMAGSYGAIPDFL